MIKEFYVEHTALCNYKKAKQILEEKNLRLPNKEELTELLIYIQKQGLDLKLPIKQTGKDYWNVYSFYKYDINAGGIFANHWVLGYYAYPLKNGDPKEYVLNYYRSKPIAENKMEDIEQFTLIWIPK